MQVTLDELTGPKLLTPTVFRDERGYFFESFNQRTHEDLGATFVQDNLALSKKDTVRGLHYQSDPGQAKLVSCLKGQVWDVVVDIRPESENFKSWAAVMLDDQNHHQLFIPVGFAHGYCVLSDEALVQYKVSTFYDPKTECSIRWSDPTVGISWPCESAILSERDRISPFFNEIFV